MDISIGSGGDSLAQIVTAWAALAAAIFGPTAGYLAARHQARRSTVSIHRQQWIDALRNDIAELLVICSRLHRAKNESLSERNSLAVEAQLFISRIELRLNPGEEPHSELVRLLRDCLRAANGSSEATKDWPSTRRDTLDAAKAVLKAEWRVVKTGR